MRLKDLPKKLYNLDGELFGILVYDGYEPFEFKGRTLQVRRCHYVGDLYGDGTQEQFTTSESDTLWLCFLYDAFVRSGGKLRELSKFAVGSYKKFKFRHKPTWLRKYKARLDKFHALAQQAQQSGNV